MDSLDWYTTKKGVNMKKLQRYTPEFRAEAINLVFEQSLSLEAAAKRLGISEIQKG